MVHGHVVACAPLECTPAHAETTKLGKDVQLMQTSPLPWRNPSLVLDCTETTSFDVPAQAARNCQARADTDCGLWPSGAKHTTYPTVHAEKWAKGHGWLAAWLTC